MTTALQTVQNFQKSLENGTDDWQSLLADDVVFKGPVDTVKGKGPNIELNKGFRPMIKGYKSSKAFGQGDLVALEGTFTVSTPKGNTIQLAMAEIYEVKNGKIQNINVYYDAEEFRREFAPSK